MGVKGMMETCCRCEQTIFLKYIKTNEGSNYGSKYDVYESLPDDWINQGLVGTLCPQCAKEFRRIMTNFYGRDKVPKSWEDSPIEPNLA